MANAVAASFVLSIFLQVWATRAGPAAADAPWAAEACEALGALREDGAGALSVCAAGDEAGVRDGRWTRVWTPSHAPALSSRAAPNCTGIPGEWACDSDCILNGVCLANGQWLQAQNCQDSNKVCREGKCIDDDGSPCSTEDERVTCLDAGTYPSLSDCSQYYVCDPSSSDSGVGVGDPRQCPPGRYFDACTKECDIVSSDSCPWAARNACAQPGATGVAPNNDRLYYVCALSTTGTSSPVWSKCSAGHYNLETLSCEREELPGCLADNESTTTTKTTAITLAPTDTEEVDPTTTTTSTLAPTDPEEIDPTTTTTSTLAPTDPEEIDPTTSTTFTTTTPTEPPLICPAPGVQPNPDTNCSFYYCYPDGSYIGIDCNSGYHFEQISGSCVSGECT